jgi:anaerobic ribonucleoside-triphosphate reductase activating protein
MKELKYINFEIVAREVPDEISLAINICGCPNSCPGCHSSYLQEDNGIILDENEFVHLMDINKGISCVSFMGGDLYPEYINYLAERSKKHYPEIKTCWYSGNKEINEKINLSNFDFIKIGPYIEKLGALDKPTTNQIFYFIKHNEDKNILINKTNLFFKQ